MLAILILFITGLCTMFASFLPYRNLPKYLGMTGILITLACIHFHLGIGIEFPSFFSWSTSPLTKLMSVIALIILFFIFLLHRRYESDYDWSAVLSLMLFSTCGVILLFGQRNLLSLFLGIEIMSIPLYVLAASKRSNASSLEAGLKYFIMGSFASAFLLFGIALIYGTTGSFAMDDIIKAQSIRGFDLPSYFSIGMIFIIASVLFKMAMAPFHFWSPDVYDGSPTIVTTFMTTVAKLGSAITMYYVLAGFFSQHFELYLKFLIPIICISLIVGSVLGLLQSSVKRMLAYSSITHIAFVLSAILLGIAMEDFAIFVFYLLTYTFASLLIFLILDYVGDGNSVFLDHFNGLKTKQPILAIAFSIGILSMAGIPFTGGFIAKFRVLAGLYQLNIWLFIFAILSSAIAIAYYLKLINRIYFYKNNQENVAVNNLSLIIFSVIFSLILIVLGVFPELILTEIHAFFIKA